MAAFVAFLRGEDAPETAVGWSPRRPQERRREREDPGYRAQREWERYRRRMEREWSRRDPAWDRSRAVRITLAEASVYSRIPVSTLRSAVKRGTLGADKRGRDWLTSLGSLEHYLKHSHGKRGRASSFYGELISTERS